MSILKPQQCLEGEEPGAQAVMFDPGYGHCEAGSSPHSLPTRNKAKKKNCLVLLPLTLSEFLDLYFSFWKGGGFL